MLLRLLTFCFLLLALASPAFAAGDDTPAWLQQALGAKLPAYDKDVAAVVLVDDVTVTVKDDGSVVKVRNLAVRILQREGRAYAAATVGYVPDSGKVKEIRAWLIPSGGTVKRYGRDETIDLAGDLNDVYNEYRVKRIIAVDDADAGSVFGFTYTTEERSIFTQDDFDFQASIPVLSSRYTLALPDGWRAESVTFNHEKIEPRVSGSTYSWELTNLSPVPDEPLSPSITNLAARLAVSYYPPVGKTVSGIRTFANWNEVGSWLGDLEDPQATIDDGLSNKAKQLIANAKTEYEKIQAIGRYVQSIQYISIQTGLGRGGGYRPHSATEVFAKSYGDCKDKANLMRAMLKAVGITAFPVSIYSGDREYVRAEWASPQQFNHCIVAVKISDETTAATVIVHPRLGRLLIFDPTDTQTDVGDLPFYLQGSLALINSKDSEALTKMPVTPPEMNQLERRADFQLGSDGAITGSIRENSRGQVAARFRSEFRRLSRAEYNSAIERWVTNGAVGARVGKVEAADNVIDGRFSLDVEFAATAYGQLMQDRLLVFNPVIVSRREGLDLTSKERKHAIVLDANSYSEVVHVKLPAGFVVDEMPDPIKLETSFASYGTTYEVKNGELIFTRSLAQRSATIPVDQYQSVRSFFERIRAAEQSPVVLTRK